MKINFSLYRYQKGITPQIKSRKVRCLCGFLAFCLLFELGVFFVALNYICLSFMQIHAIFYFNYIIYSGLLIFCCQNVAKNVLNLYFPFWASFLIVPIFLSLRVSRPSLFLIVPAGKPCFFSNVPTVQSLLVFLILIFPFLNDYKSLFILLTITSILSIQFCL